MLVLALWISVGHLEWRGLAHSKVQSTAARLSGSAQVLFVASCTCRRNLILSQSGGGAGCERGCLVPLELPHMEQVQRPLGYR